MADVTLKEVKQLAGLCRIAFPEEELKTIQKDLSRILEYVERLQKAPLDGVKPVSHIGGLVNEGRDDIAKETLASSDEVLRAAPEKKERWVKVPLIMNSKVKSQNSKVQVKS